MTMLRKRSALDASLDDQPQLKVRPRTDQLTYQQVASDFFCSRPSHLQQLRVEFGKGPEGDYRRTLFLIREVVKQRDLPSNLATRMLKFCVYEDLAYLARQLLTRHVVRLSDRAGGELLWFAVDAGRREVAALLIEHGADMNIRKPDDHSTFLHAVVSSEKIVEKREELVGLMLERGVDVNARDAKGRSALNCAILHKHCSDAVVELLLKNGAKVSVDDIYAATSRKPDLLPTLVQDPVVETRNLRGAMAIENLIKKQCATDDRVRLIEKILELGVPVDGDDPFMDKRWGKRPSSLLSLALFHQEEAVVKLLLDHGANPHRKNEFGHTPLFQATAFQNHTNATRWLIEKGANIHDRNDDGCYPIHGACETKSLKNVHLLLNLGADLGVTDHEGRTPFCYTDDSPHFNATDALLVKHFSLTVARDGKMSYEDMEKINKHAWSENLFGCCAMQLERMRVETVHEDVSYFGLLSWEMFGKMRLMESPNFAKTFMKNKKKRADLFPQYSHMLLHSFEIAKKRYETLQVKKEQLRECFSGITDYAIEHIMSYSNSENLSSYRHDYYMALHASLKSTEADKKKIM